MTLPAILYAAKSTADPKGSIGTQLEDGRALALSEGLAVQAEYHDEARSAYKQSRGDGLAQAKEHAAALASEHGECALIVQHTDRLARGDAIQAAHLVEHYLWALKASVKLRSVQDDHNLDDMLRAVLIGERNFEDSKRKALATKAGMKRSVENGKRQGGPTPFGFKEGEAPILESIFRDFVAGQSMSGIAKALHTAGVPTRRGGRWDASTIKAILRNPCYIGFIRWDDQLINAGEGPLIPQALWAEAQQLLDSKPSSRRGRPTRTPTLFRAGLLRCQCGASLSPRTRSDGVPIYRCTTNIKLGKDACPMPEIKASEIDQKVIEYFLRCGVDIEATRQRLLDAMAQRIKSERSVLQSAERAEREATAALERLDRGFMNGSIEEDDYSRMADKAKSELAGARAELERLRAQEAQALASVGLEDVEQELLKRLAEIKDASGNIEAIRAALTRTFERFVIHVDGAEGRIEATLKPQSIKTVDEEIRPILRPTALELGPQPDVGNNEEKGCP